MRRKLLEKILLIWQPFCKVEFLLKDKLLTAIDPWTLLSLAVGCCTVVAGRTAEGRKYRKIPSQQATLLFVVTCIVAYIMQGLTTRGAVITSRDTDDGDLTCHLSDWWLTQNGPKEGSRLMIRDAAWQQAVIMVMAHRSPNWTIVSCKWFQMFTRALLFNPTNKIVYFS